MKIIPIGIFVVILTILILGSINKIKSGYPLEGYVITEKREACKIYKGKYNNGCCYTKGIQEGIVVKECNIKQLQERAFIYLNF